MRRILLLTALLAGLAMPASAEAQVRWVTDGAGWGHGIGMSQHGALGFAQNGSDYRRILAHYYRGTEIGSAGGRTIRVLLGDGRASVKFDGARGVNGRKLDPAKTYTATRRNGKVRIGGVGTFSGLAKVRGNAIRWKGRSMNGVSNGRWRSYLELRPSGSGGLTVVNALGLDNYVRGVIAGEMPSSWHAEALKAQAIAARSYALTTDRGGPVFDQYPDVRSQVYRGVTGERASTNAAVSATSGEVVTYDGQVAVTYFFSTSGGHTENVENSFVGAAPKPWLKGVDDPYDDVSPRHRWRFVFTQSQMQSRLSGLVKGTFRGIEVVKRGVSPRVVHADIVGSGGRTRVTGPTLRARLGIYDTWFTMKKVTGTEAKRYEPTHRTTNRTQKRRGTSLQSSGWVQSPPATSPESSPAESWPSLG
ncbi:MAG: SpoIID/LytB domain-containing protein [Actinomycetota bacterium]|nr:SpoIID/LytB domain-containing protein [Actinomycetota bacterium]